jgi:hypothetical protein
MDTQTPQQENTFTPEALKARLASGFQKSVATMVEDIVKEYALRLDNGTREFKYIKSWPHKGSFMSAAYTQGDCMKAESSNGVGYNTTLQSQEDIDRFTELVCNELKEKHGIEIKDSLVEYRDNKTGWHHMRFDLVLTLTE